MRAQMISRYIDSIDLAHHPPSGPPEDAVALVEGGPDAALVESQGQELAKMAESQERTRQRRRDADGPGAWSRKTAKGRAMACGPSARPPRSGRRGRREVSHG